MIFAKKNKDVASCSDSATIIGSGVSFIGDISSVADIRIDGTIKGNVSCTSRVLIGVEGFVEGNVDCMQADIMGKIKGNLVAKELVFLHGEANVDGDIYVVKLQIEPPAVFNGHCYMVPPDNAALIQMTSEKFNDTSTIAFETETSNYVNSNGN